MTEAKAKLYRTLTRLLNERDSIIRAGEKYGQRDFHEPDYVRAMTEAAHSYDGVIGALTAQINEMGDEQ